MNAKSQSIRGVAVTALTISAALLLAGCLGLFGQPPGGAPGGGGSGEMGAGGGDGGVGPGSDGGGDGGGGADAGGDGGGMTETLSVAFDTTAAGGQYMPNNVVAIWIQDAGGAFIKTIGRWGDTRKEYLLDWIAKAGPNDVDVISLASRTSHADRLMVTWDMKTRDGSTTPDGTYTIRMELADRNSTTNATNHEGSFSFVRNGTASTQNVSGNGFNAVTIQYSGR